MMLRRRTPRATEGATSNPSSSGPRCRSASIIRRVMASARSVRSNPMTPQIPHMVLFGAANQNFSRPYKLVAQTHADDAKLPGTIPTKNQSHRQSQTQHENRNRQHGKRFALEQQRPVHRLFPGGPDKVECPTKKGSSHGNPSETNVGRRFVGVC